MSGKRKLGIASAAKQLDLARGASAAKQLDLGPGASAAERAMS